MREPLVGPHDAKIAIIGQAPPRSASAHPLKWGCTCEDCRKRGRALAITGRVGDRLERLAGLEEGELQRRVLRGNLVDWWPGPSLTGKGDFFPVRSAEEGWMKMVPFLRGKHTILLGRATAKVCGVGDHPWMQWREVHPEYFISVMPHPSGIVRWWNDPHNRAHAEHFLREVFNG